MDSLAASAAVDSRVGSYSLPHPLTLFSMPAGNGMCRTQGWEGRARGGKRSEGKECSVSEQFLSCLTYSQQAGSLVAMQDAIVWVLS